MAAVVEKEKKADGRADLISVLAAQEMEIQELLSLVPLETVAHAWARGDIDIGATKYVTSGNPEISELTHNGIREAKPAVIIEHGIEWPLPNTRLLVRAPLAKVLAEKLPECASYQKYQLEVCTDYSKDVWEWLERLEDVKGRKTRWARREITRAEAEKLFVRHVRLTERALAAA